MAGHSLFHVCLKLVLIFLEARSAFKCCGEQLMQGAISARPHTQTMPRHGKPAELTINLKSATDTSHTTSRPKSSPIEVDLSSFGGDLGTPQQEHSGAKAHSSSSPSSSPRHNRDPSRNFLSNFKSKKAPEQELEHYRTQARRAKEGEDDYRPGSSSMSKVYHLRNNPGSTPELSLVGSADNVSKNGDGK